MATHEDQRALLEAMSQSKEAGITNELRIELPPEVPLEEARLVLLIALFQNGRLSRRQAMRLAGQPRRAFIEILAEHGVAVFDYSAEDLADESETQRRPRATALACGHPTSRCGGPAGGGPEPPVG